MARAAEVCIAFNLGCNPHGKATGIKQADGRHAAARLEQRLPGFAQIVAHRGNKAHSRNSNTAWLGNHLLGLLRGWGDNKVEQCRCNQLGADMGT